MRAAVYRAVGGSDVLGVEEIQTPEPGPGEVRVKIECSGVNPTDWKSRSGISGDPPEGFQVPHQDGAGTIDAIGPGIDGRSVGQRVWVYFAAKDNRYGTAAEYSVLSAERTVPLPDGVSFDLGASLGVPAITAAHTLGGERSALKGKSVLVAGGAGAVGHYAIELAKHAGARVATTVSGDAKAELARAAGADLIVNYRSAGAIDELRTFASPFDRIVELAIGANKDADLALSGPDTVIAVYAAEPEDPVIPIRRFMASNAEIHFVLLYGVPAERLRRSLSWVTAALDEGAITALPFHRFSLDEVSAAQEAVENGAVGKVVVVP